jgi:hypothetical protein
MARAKPKRLLQRGGKRLDGQRQTMQLTMSQCTMLIEAAYRANDEGQPFNRFITLLWERAGIDGRNAVQITGRFIKLAKQWARRHGYRLEWAWVQEWGPVNRAHIHMLLHVPLHLDWQFRLMPRRWAKLCLGGRYVSKTVDSQRIKAGWFGLSYEGALLHRVHYMLKCSPAELESELHMVGCGKEPWGKRGLTYGKRLAASQIRSDFKMLAQTVAT